MFYTEDAELMDGEPVKTYSYRRDNGDVYLHLYWATSPEVLWTIINRPLIA